ncbi:MAG: hypothetical protein AAFV69_02205 [Pseudomonadota bacterium]
MTLSKSVLAVVLTMAVVSFGALSANATPNGSWHGTGVHADTFKGD